MITLAVEAARRAGQVLVESFGRASLEVHEKGEADFVTEVDRRAEDTVREFLAAELPEHGFLLEEGGAIRPEAEYQWVVDPLDGTTNYIHRYPFFSVSIALRKKGETILGVVYDPIRSECFTAEKGEAARLNGIPVGVSRAESLRTALVCTGFPFRIRERLDAYLGAFRAVFLACGGMRRDGSAALDLAYVACGRYDAFWELGLKPWDTSAGALLVECAGGRVTDFHGGGEAIAGGDIVASNGAVHEALVGLLRGAFPERPLDAT